MISAKPLVGRTIWPRAEALELVRRLQAQGVVAADAIATELRVSTRYVWTLLREIRDGR
jgi:hypothetical protein